MTDADAVQAFLVADLVSRAGQVVVDPRIPPGIGVFNTHSGGLVVRDLSSGPPPPGGDA